MFQNLRIRNFTPHDVNIELESGEKYTCKSEGIARINTKTTQLKDGFYFQSSEELVGFPSNVKQGEIIIVSAIVQEYCKKHSISNVASPATVFAKRDNENKVLSVPGLII